MLPSKQYLRTTNLSIGKISGSQLVQTKPSLPSSTRRINYEATIKPKVDALESYGDANDDIHPDFKFICFIQEQLDRAIPTLTTDLWAFDRKADAEKKLDAKLKALYAKKKIAKANEDLGDAMDADGGANMESFVGKTVDKAVDRRIANQKKEARKNSSDDTKSQTSKSAKNGKRYGDASATNHHGRRS